LFHNPNIFGSCIIHILYTGCAKLIKNNSGAKRLMGRAVRDLYIYSTNIGTEYFKHDIDSPFFSSKCSLFLNPNIFDSCIIHILYTGCAKLKKNNSGAKRLMDRAVRELYIYSTNIGTEYFKHDIDSPFFFFKMQFVS